MSNKQGDFIWYELMTDKPDKAVPFYQALLGWEIERSSPNDQQGYRICLSLDEETGDKHGVAGLLILNDAQRREMPPAWLGYIAVEDVDASIEKLEASGGSLLMPTKDIPDVGRVAMLKDPQGVPFYIMRGFHDRTSMAFAHDKPREGHCAWNELVSSSPQSAWEFYGRNFGWKKDSDMDLGDLGSYEFIRHGSMIGAIMPQSPELKHSVWVFYFRVSDIDEAVDIVGKFNGQIIQPPEEIPGGEYVIQGLDPTGAHFALVGKRDQAS